jgi:hypothetical protein
MPVIRRRLTILAVVAALIVVATIALGAYGLLRGPGQNTTRHHDVPTHGLPGDSAAASVAGERPAVLPKTDDPIRYAKAVAAALFDWSTGSGYSAADYTAPVIADADPSGEEVAGLVEDLAGYEPTSQQWAQLAAMQVAQRLTIMRAVVPSLWGQALAEAHGQLRPGTTAVTITGVRQRVGVWYGQSARTSERVSFTIFEACSPGFSRCHTLRLSKLGDPLR